MHPPLRRPVSLGQLCTASCSHHYPVMLHMWQFIAESRRSGFDGISSSSYSPSSFIRSKYRNTASPLTPRAQHSAAAWPFLPPSLTRWQRTQPPPPPPLAAPPLPPTPPRPDRQTDSPSVPSLCASSILCLRALKLQLHRPHPSLPPCPPLKAVTRAPARALSRSTNQTDRHTHTHTPFAVLPRVCTQASPAVAVRRGVSRCLHVPSHKRRACVRACVHTYINALLQGR